MLTSEQLPDVIAVVRKGTQAPITHPYATFLEDIGLENEYYQSASYLEYPEEHLDEEQLHICSALSWAGTRHAVYVDELTDTTWFVDNDQETPVVIEIIGSLDYPLVWMAYAFQQDSIVGLDTDHIKIKTL